MRIAEIHLYQHDLPVKGGPYRIASSEVWSLTSTIVKLVAHNGVVGCGETCRSARPTPRPILMARSPPSRRWRPA